MMKGFTNKGAYFKFFIYFVVVVLINIVGVTLFVRMDLTSNKLYSLSGASHEVVATLSEPLTIKVFFTKNLPAPHNATERYLHDLLEEYASASGKYFNYRFYDVTAEEGGMTEETSANRKMAEDYGVSPVQIRVIENDEVKFQQAYMGLVIIHGDMIEKIPALTSTNGLEYSLTTAIQKLNNKVSALMSLKDNVKIKLFLSSSLYKVSPLMGLENLQSMPTRIKAVVDKLNKKSLDKISYEHIDPKNPGDLDQISRTYKIMTMKWPEIPKENISAGNGGAGIVMEYRDKVEVIPLITTLNLPIIGTTYQMAAPDSLEEVFTETMETMIGINENIGYLADHGTLSLMPAGMGMMPGQQRGTMNVFNQLISKRYAVQDVNLKEKGVPKGLKTLIIARPTEEFSDYELFLIDQALMKGTNIAFFIDAFNEVMPARNTGFGGGPQYIPLNTGLEKLLNHYGITMEKAYVMDENCYKQMKPPSQGGGEQDIYFAPIIKDANINNSPAFMKNIKGIISMKISPLELDEKKIEQSGIEASRLFSSSDKSWLMTDRINLNPMFIRPPGNSSDMSSHALAYMLEGEFSSYFAGKSIPEKETDEKEISDKNESNNSGAMDGSDGNTDSETVNDKKEMVPEKTEIKAENNMVTKGKPGKIFVMACSSMLQDNMLDPEGRTTNSAFILNVIDHLNDRDEIAEMRSKNQTMNPLAETSSFARGFIKTFNIAGLPVLVIMFGFIVLAGRRAKKKRIKLMFQKR